MTGPLFRIIVADDEEELLEAICRMIDWESIGFVLVGSANNGLDALQLVEQYQPDLLLTDIEMPFIKGTELAEQARMLQPLIQIAFLSGYDDFEYAQSAIENRIISYLLKPISMAELTDALREIHVKMEERLAELRPASVHISQHLTVASLLLDAENEGIKEETLVKRLHEGRMLPDEGPFSCVVLSLNAGNPAYNAGQTVENVLRKYYQCCSFVSGERVLSLLISEDNFAHLDRALDELYYAGKNLLFDRCVIGVSRPFDKLGKATEARWEAVDTEKNAQESGIYYFGRSEGVGLMCKETLKIIEKEFADEDLSLNSVSERLHVSPNYLSANMKKYAGDTFINLLISRRMEEAQELIRRENLRISEIAERCGYSDQHYFSFCFKKYYGISPAKMRQEAGSE